MNKTAFPPYPARTMAMLGALSGLGAGAYVGHKVTPERFGYGDNEGVSNLAAAIHGAAGAGLGAEVLHDPKKWWTRIKNQPHKAALGAGVGLAGMELVPKYLASQDAIAARPTLMSGIRDAVTSPTGKGMLAGGAGAAALGLLTGLSRGPHLSELERGAGRGSMVARDALTYLLPALAAGGVIGSTRQ